MARKENMEKLHLERERLKAQIASLEGELRGIERAINMLKGNDADSNPNPVYRKRQRGGIKDVVLKMVEDSGSRGTVASEIVEKAEKSGQSLDRNSVSSLLSRLKREGSLSYDDGRYRVKLIDPMS